MILGTRTKHAISIVSQRKAFVSSSFANPWRFPTLELGFFLGGVGRTVVEKRKKKKTLQAAWSRSQMPFAFFFFFLSSSTSPPDFFKKMMKKRPPALALPSNRKWALCYYFARMAISFIIKSISISAAMPYAWRIVPSASTRNMRAVWVIE